MFLSKKIRLLPTSEQEALFRKSAGVSRWAFNYFLGENERVFKEYIANGNTGQKYLTGNEVRRYINNVLKKTTHTWLADVSSSVMKQAVKDAEWCLNQYFKSNTGKPRFKSKRRNRPSFYVNYETLIKTNNGFRGERIGYIKTCEPLPKIGKGEHYLKPHITFDGHYWFLSVTYKTEPYQVELTGESLGIDLGVKNLAICSNGKVYKNINKTKRVKQLEKKLKQQERKLSRKIKANTKCCDKNGKPIFIKSFDECKNFQKQKLQLKILHGKICNIRMNYLHQTTTEIVKTKPSRIVMETLSVKNMIKNKSLSKAIGDQCFYEFKRQIAYKCEMYGIEFVQVDMYYPSSKMCSSCGNVKKTLSLSERTYHCECCGLTIDRDLNASYNLANYFI